MGQTSFASGSKVVEKYLVVPVLSGNHNFNRRIHSRAKEAYLASPVLIIAYAIAGTLNIDIAAIRLAMMRMAAPCGYARRQRPARRQ